MFLNTKSRTSVVSVEESSKQQKDWGRAAHGLAVGESARKEAALQPTGALEVHGQLQAGRGQGGSSEAGI